jgi:hypothetical protein
MDIIDAFLFKFNDLSMVNFMQEVKNHGVFQQVMEAILNSGSIETIERFAEATKRIDGFVFKPTKAGLSEIRYPNNCSDFWDEQEHDFRVLYTISKYPHLNVKLTYLARYVDSEPEIWNYYAACPPQCRLKSFTHPDDNLLVNVCNLKDLKNNNKLLRNADWISPFSLKYIEDLTSNVELKKELRLYARWSPSPVQKTWWYGPFFRRRAYTLMLVCLRYRIPRHVAYIAVAHLADTEIVRLPVDSQMLILE